VDRADVALWWRSLKHFGDLRAVNEIDLDLPEGGVAGFVGPNGAGKSTTIRMLLGLITPTGGEGEVFGHPIGRPAAYLHRVGALIEAPAFYPALTGEANLTELTAGRRRAGTALPRHHRRLRHDGPYPPDRRTGPSHRIRSCPDRPPHRRLRRDRGLDPHARRP
jgi:ABC-type uncharacterized transport system ATPase subunit